MEVKQEQKEWSTPEIFRILRPKTVLVLLSVLLVAAIITVTAISGRLSTASDNTLIVEQYKAQYEGLYGELAVYREANDKNLAALQDVLGPLAEARSQVISLTNQNKKLEDNAKQLRVQLYAAVEARAYIDQDVSDSEAAVIDIKLSLDALQEKYDNLKIIMAVVDNGENETVNGFTTEERIIFYDIWHAWWEANVEGNQ